MIQTYADLELEDDVDDSASLECESQAHAFYAFYAWWLDVPQSGALRVLCVLCVLCVVAMAEGTSRPVSQA
jgi:hypothetical protein